MDILLWRHAEAEIGVKDLERSLTPKGIAQSKTMGKWIKNHFPKDYKLLVSQANRSQETAKTLNRSFRICPELNPEANSHQVLAFLKKFSIKNNLIIVGHQPWISDLCKSLIYSPFDLSKNFSGELQHASFSFKKGAFCWLELKKFNNQPNVKLRALISPNLMIL